MVRKLRQAATSDPRATYITKLLKENKIKEAKTVAKKGKIMLKGKPVKMLILKDKIRKSLLLNCNVGFF